MAKRVLLVTGAASGIGAAVTKLAADQGWTVAVCDVNRDAGQSLAQATGGRFFYCDVTDLSSVSSAVEGCISELGVPNYAHLNAGVMTVPAGQPYLALEDLSQAQYRNIVGVNLDGVFHGAKTLIPHMRPTGGAITLTASTAGLSVVGVDPMYTATKYAVIGLGRAVAAANQDSDLRVNVICPGVTDTAIVPEEFKAPEFNMMPAEVIAREVLDLLENGANGEVRVKASAQTPAFASRAELMRD